MSQEQKFPKEKLLQALENTKQIKSKAKHILQAFNNTNIPWIFECLSTLYNVFVNPKNSPRIRFNSILALKLFLSTCDYVAVNVIETYFINILMHLATVDHDKPQPQRGFKYYIQSGHSASTQPEIEQYGFNTVLLGTQLLRAAAIIKPKRLYYTQESADASDFVVALEKVLKKVKGMQNKLQFFQKESPQALHEKFLERSRAFEDDQKLDNYCNYIQTVFVESLKAGFQKDQTRFDIREYIKKGDFFIDGPLDVCNTAIAKAKPATIINCLNFFHDLVLAANPQILITLHENEQIFQFVKAVIGIPGQNRELRRGEAFFQGKKWSPEQKYNVYTIFLMRLEVWSHTFIRQNPKTGKNSKIANYYEYLKNVKDYEFPKNPNLQKEIKESEIAFKRNKTKNKAFLKENKGEMADEIPVPFLQAIKSSDSKVDSSKNVKESEKKISQSKIKEQESPKKVQSNQKIVSNKSIPQSQQESSKKIEKQEQSKKIESQQETSKNESKLQIQSKESKKIQSQKETSKISSKNQIQSKESKIKEEEKKESTKSIGKEQESSKKISSQQESSKSIKEKQSQKNLTSQEQIKKESTVKGDSQQIVSPPPSKESIKQVESKVQSEKKISPEKNPSETSIQVEARKSTLKEENRVSEKNMQSKKSIENDSMRGSFKKQKNEPNFKEHLSVVENTIKGLVESETSIKEKMEYLSREKKVLEGQAQSSDLKDDQIQFFMEKYFKCVDSIDSLQGEYLKYTNGKIPLSNFISYVNSINGKKIGKTEKQASLSAIPEESNMKKREYIEEKEKTSQVHQEPLKVIKLEIPIYKKQQNSRVDFESEYSQSQVSQYVEGEQVQEVKISVVREELNIESFQTFKKSVRKFNESYKSQLRSKLQQPKLQESVQNKDLSQSSPIKELGSKFYEKEQSKSHEKNLEIVEELEMKNSQILQQNEDDYIEGPELNPLEQSFHELEESEKRPKKTFKEILTANKYVKGGKGENLFWLKNQTQSLIKPIGNRKNKAASRVSIPEIIEEKNKKFQSEIRLLQEYKDKRIRELEHRLEKVEKQKEYYQKEVSIKQSEIQTLKEQSIGDGKSNYEAQQMRFMMRQKEEKLKLLEKKSVKSKEIVRLNTNGKLLNIRWYSQFFTGIINEKDKKKQLKNKELFNKDRKIQIGCMGHREKNKYIITCYLTPQNDTIIEKIFLNKNDNLNIAFENREGKKIVAKKQEKIHFTVQVVDIPFLVPEVFFEFSQSDKKMNYSFILPCAYHKFFKIDEIPHYEMKQYFLEEEVLRGEEIPYSKKVLKTYDMLMDYLPHLQKLNDEDGEICFGGKASYKEIEFALKIRIKPNQFLYIQCVNYLHVKEIQRSIEFYIASLNHLLMKEISWA